MNQDFIRQSLEQGVAAQRGGRLVEAEQCYRTALSANSDHAEANYLLGTLLVQRQQPAEGEKLLAQAIAREPNQPGPHFHHGIALVSLRRLPEAVASFDRAIALKPDYVEAHNKRGMALGSLGRRQEAVASFDNAIALRPDHVGAFVNRGVALMGLERGIDAIASFDSAIALRPDFVDGVFLRGKARLRIKQAQTAMADFEHVLVQKPAHAEARLGRARALIQLGRLVDGLANYDQVIALKPDHAAAFSERGDVLSTLERPDEALASLKQARTLDPDLPYVQSAILRASMQLCDWRDFARDSAALLAHVTEGRIREAPSALLSVGANPEQQRRSAEQYSADKFPPLSPPLWRGEIYRHGRIRVAYLSNSFRNHPTMILMGGLFGRHDKAHFETVALSLSGDDGSVARRRLANSFDRFIDVSSRSDEDIAAQIKAWEIDILVDLDGFSEGSRTGILARRAAPVQVNYLGYPGTLGASYVDYILADPVLIGTEDERFYTEKIVRLPDSYQPNSNRLAPVAPPSRANLGLPEAGFVFCCFNAPHKITPDIFDLWMRLLNQVPGSVLWLLAMNETARKNLAREAQARGVAAERLVFADVTDQQTHIARQGQADLFLDTLPCNGHITASDALWAGLPLLTCRGETLAGRVATSLLGAAGLPELAAGSLADYETLALRLARAPALLKSFKDRLAQTRATSALFDSDRFVRHLETAYARMAEIARRSLPAQSFDVTQAGKP